MNICTWNCFDHTSWNVKNVPNMDPREEKSTIFNCSQRIHRQGNRLYFKIISKLKRKVCKNEISISLTLAMVSCRLKEGSSSSVFVACAGKRASERKLEFCEKEERGFLGFHIHFLLQLVIEFCWLIEKSFKYFLNFDDNDTYFTDLITWFQALKKAKTPNSYDFISGITVVSVIMLPKAAKNFAYQEKKNIYPNSFILS